MTMSKGRLIIFSAPSGCGKGTMLAEILKDERFGVSVSATTRAPRTGETEGVNYYYLSEEEFQRRVDAGEFLEHAVYCEHQYGTLNSEVDRKLAAGVNVILEIEVQGAADVMKKRPDAITVFILPPSVEELRRRLHKRGTEPEEVIEKRIAQAEYEMGFAGDYKYNIVNDALEDAVSDFFAIIRAEELRTDINN